jgi:hypothetical protein
MLCIKYGASHMEIFAPSVGEHRGRRVKMLSSRWKGGRRRKRVRLPRVENRGPFDFLVRKMFPARFELVVYTLQRHTYH